MKQSAFLENVLMALTTLREHKLRSGLTVLGVVIGTMTVIVIAAFVSGIEARVKKEMESFGTNSIYIYKFSPGFNFNPSREERMREPISYEDGMAIKAECQNCAEVAVFMSPVPFDKGAFVERPNVRYRDTEMINATLTSATPDYFRMGTIDLDEGRFFTDAENEHRADVAVIGQDVANTLFPGISPIDREIQVGGRSYRIVGVLEKRETFLVPDEDPNNENKTVYIPYLSLRKIYPNLKDHFVMVEGEVGRVAQAVDEIRQILRKRRNCAFNAPDNFGVQTSDEIIAQFNSITRGTFLLMVAISSVGLLVGGIGVMNIMLVSVTERTREIGMRKAIGARRYDIVLQFLVEAATLTGAGGILGILFGVGTAQLVKMLMPTFIPLWAPIVGFLVSIFLGVFFGLWPAWKASRLDPIEALRHE